MKIINEEKLKPVITSKQVMIENKPITNVIKKMMLILFQ